MCEVGHEAGVSDCVCMSAKQSISLLADSSWSLGQYRSPGKPSVTTVPTRHLLDTDSATDTCAHTVTNTHT